MLRKVCFINYDKASQDKTSLLLKISTGIWSTYVDANIYAEMMTIQPYDITKQAKIRDHVTIQYWSIEPN